MLYLSLSFIYNRIRASAFVSSSPDYDESAAQMCFSCRSSSLKYGAEDHTNLLIELITFYKNSDSMLRCFLFCLF